jgi:hypothetical protein
MAEARYGRQNRYDDIRRVCEGAVSIPFQEYIGFLEKSGYLRHDRASESLEVARGAVVNGGNSPSSPSARSALRLRQSRAMAVPDRRSDGPQRARAPRTESARAGAAAQLPREG